MSAITVIAPVPTTLELRHTLVESSLAPLTPLRGEITALTIARSPKENKENIPLVTTSSPPKPKKSKRAPKAHLYDILEGGARRRLGSDVEPYASTSGRSARNANGRAQRRATLACPWSVRRIGRDPLGSDDSGTDSRDTSVDLSTSMEASDIHDLLVEARVKELTESPLADVTAAYDESVLGSFFALATSSSLEDMGRAIEH